MSDANPSPTEGARKRVTLALQGGGSHGAFTWGVLDRLAEEPSLDIQAISGTSAGALNAAVFACGFVEGGAQGAKQRMADFWRSVSDAGKCVFNPFRYVEDWPALGPFVSWWVGMLSSLWSPYDNFFYANRLKPLLEQAVDFKRLSATSRPALFICATNVRTNQRRVFRSEELNPDVLLASACLPQVFRAVGINGEDFWDGGYMGNPVLSPLLKHAEDMVIVGVNPINRDDTPRSATEIADRLNEITFNSALVHELDMINVMNKLIAKGELNSPRYKSIRMHIINAEREMSRYGEQTKSHTSWPFLTELHALGRETASAWLNDPEQFGQVGRSASYDVQKELIDRMYLYPGQKSNLEQAGRYVS